MRLFKAFTLMKLLVVLLIIAVLAIIAVPTYQGYVLRTSRMDAIQTLLAIQLAEEKYRMSNPTYGNLAQVWSGVTVTEGGRYNLTITNVTSTTFTIQADATGSQMKDREDSVACTLMTLTYSAGVVTKFPSVCWLKD